MKKPILFLSPLVLLASCGYPSFYEANYSCLEWQRQGEKYSGVIKAIPKSSENKDSAAFLFKDTVNSFSTRKCEKDKHTNQVLGFVSRNRDGGRRYIFSQSQRLKNQPSKLLDINIDWQVQKRFRY